MKFLFLLFLLTGHVWGDVSKDQVSIMLDQMVKDNVISPIEAEKAKIKLKGLTAGQWSEMNQVGKSRASRGPASVQNEESAVDEKKINLESAQFQQIQEDIKKIFPQN